MPDEADSTPSVETFFTSEFKRNLRQLAKKYRRIKADVQPILDDIQNGQMPRKYYTEDEITLCTYVAIYNAADLGGVEIICTLTGRSMSSILMKIRNIISMLNVKGVTHSSSMVGLTGRTTGVKTRETNWDIVEPLTHLSQQEHLRKCLDIIHKTRS
jgi:hypothetical protein